MIMYVILGIALVLFLWGVSFILKAYRSPQEEAKVVPISDLKEITELRHVDSPSIAQHVIDENIKKTSAPAAKFPADLSSEVGMLKEQLLSQAKDFQTEINKLRAENKNLNLALVKEVEKSAQPAVVAQPTADPALKETQEKLERVLKNLEGLSVENLHLKKKLEAERNKVQEGLNILQQSQQKIEVLENELSELRSQHNKLLEGKDAEIIQNLKSSQSTVEQLSISQQELVKNNQLLHEEIAQLKAFNLQIAEKERMYQYELTKSRAQIIGLEQICEDYKEQIEHLSSSLTPSQRKS